jgi:protein TonB
MPAHVDTVAGMIAHAAVTPTVGRPLALPSYRFGCAGLMSLALHAVVGLLVMGVVVRVPEVTAPIRVLLYQPAPAPPPAIAAAQVPVPIVDEKKPVVRTNPLRRNAAPHVAARSMPAVPTSEPAAVAEAVPSQNDMAEGRRDGVVGGIPGGMPGGTGRALLSADQVPYQPVAISEIKPEYPPLARLRGIEGQVVLEAILAADGRIEPDITVVQSIPPLDAAAITAVRRWRFRPARDRDGAPVRVTLRVPVRFVLR